MIFLFLLIIFFRCYIILDKKYIYFYNCPN